LDSELEANALVIDDHFTFVFKPFEISCVNEAMQYALSGGKKLRGYLVNQSSKLFEIDPSKSIWAACSIEALHAYSLVHDDLPAMDDDDLRRGKPTVHKKWDDATAILTGDALQTLSFQLLTDQRFRVSDAHRLKLAYDLSVASGADGMVLGQALDILAETSDVPLDLDDITRMQRRKTGALIEWSACSGAVMSGEDPSALLAYSKSVGLAFQIIDDILDVEGDPLKVGKRVKKDQNAGKATFVSLLGMDTAKKHSRTLIDKANDALMPYGNKAKSLQRLANFVISRSK
jgi:farnesyl diphosphate synthase